MSKGKIWVVILSLLLLTTSSSFALANISVNKADINKADITSEKNSFIQSTEDSTIKITSPEPGYLYLFQLRPIKMPISSALGLKNAVVIGRSIRLDTEYQDIDHVKFVAKRLLAGWETVRYDYNKIDGLSMDLGLKTGIYDITAYAYDDNEVELGSDSIRVLYVKVGGDDFGMWVNTRYDNGETFRTPINIGLADFISMLSSGESKEVLVPLQKEDDTTVEMRFTRTKILGGTENVIQSEFNVDTSCDTTKDYETSLEIRFPFALLDGGDATNPTGPYFSAKVGYRSYSALGAAPNNVETTFFFGRENANDPRVFRMSLMPNSLDSDSKLTFYNSYRTVDSEGNEIFYREFSTEFEPATELTITTVPGQAKVIYDFGNSAGIPTKISFRAQGGLLDDIVQSFNVDPLPEFMSFDLTIIGLREFIYESDSTYDVTYSLDSIEDGNLVTFEVEQVPETIHASWGIELGQLADLNVSGFAHLDMSQEVERVALYFLGNTIPFFEIENFPNKLNFDSYVDVLSGKGHITIARGVEEDRDMNIAIQLDELVVTKQLQLKNNLVEILWDINTVDGHGDIEIFRDSETTISYSTIISYQDWTFTKTILLKNNYIHLGWNLNRNNRQGNIIFERDSEGGDPTITLSIAHDNWEIANSLELKNDYIEFYWDLPDDTDNHAEIGLYTGGEDMFYDTVSITDDSTTLLSFGIGISTSDHFFLSWDNDGGQISNFEWSGRILNIENLDISVNLPGDVLTISGSWTVGETGSLAIELNKPVTINFLDIETDRFKIHGHISFYADRRLDVSWDLDDFGYFKVDTNDEPLGQEAEFMILWDPQNQHNYRYGFDLTIPDFLETKVNVSWDRDLAIPRILVSGQIPDNWMQWDKYLLWDYDWYEIGI